jgi:hypothetical protein
LLGQRAYDLAIKAVSKKDSKEIVAYLEVIEKYKPDLLETFSKRCHPVGLIVEFPGLDDMSVEEMLRMQRRKGEIEKYSDWILWECGFAVVTPLEEWPEHRLKVTVRTKHLDSHVYNEGGIRYDMRATLEYRVLGGDEKELFALQASGEEEAPFALQGFASLPTSTWDPKKEEIDRRAFEKAKKKIHSSLWRHLQAFLQHLRKG